MAFQGLVTHLSEWVGTVILQVGRSATSSSTKWAVRRWRGRSGKVLPKRLSDLISSCRGGQKGNEGIRSSHRVGFPVATFFEEMPGLEPGGLIVCSWIVLPVVKLSWRRFLWYQLLNTQWYWEGGVNQYQHNWRLLTSLTINKPSKMIPSFTQPSLIMHKRTINKKYTKYIWKLNIWIFRKP